MGRAASAGGGGAGGGVPAPHPHELVPQRDTSVVVKIGGGLVASGGEV
jgi:hypothetical protein